MSQFVIHNDTEHITKTQNSITNILNRIKEILTSIDKYCDVYFKVEDDKYLRRGLHFPISTKPNQAVQEQTEQELKDNISEGEKTFDITFLAESM